jgi:hypothetical protein
MLLKCQTVYTWKTYILRYDFKVYVRHLYVNIKRDKNRVFFKSFEVKVINALVVISHKLKNNFKGQMWLADCQLDDAGLVCCGVSVDDGGSAYFWNVGLLQRDYTALYSRGLSSSY